MIEIKKVMVSSLIRYLNKAEINTENQFLKVKIDFLGKTYL